MPRHKQTPTALSIAGSDSGGGAGIQADLKAFARCGVHGMTAITAITAQNTVGVVAVHTVPPEIVLAQVRAVAADIGVDAVKVGMLSTAETIRAVARALDELPPGTPVVVDPVMVAESGARLLHEDAQQALVEEILPRATVLTPNLPEARVLAGRSSIGLSEDGEQTDAEVEAIARAVLALGPRVVVLTGGHRARAADLLVDAGGAGSEGEDSEETGDEKAGGARAGGARAGGARAGGARAGGARAGGVGGVRVGEGVLRVVEIPGERHPDGAAHGSGCTHSAVLAAQLALGHTPLQAARTARRLAGEAVAHGLRDLGAGAGPVDIIGLNRGPRGVP